jgi:2-methylcitrate dehydratase PrpD
MRAAFLAQEGLTGPPTVLEGEKGFCRAFADEYSLKEITAGLGKEFRILWTGHKPYCCCAAQHSVIDAVSKIAKEHAVTPKEIEEVIVGQASREVRAVGSIIEPHDITSAQFSGRFGVALRLIKGGNQFKDYSEENLRDSEILSLAKRIEYVVDEELEKLPVDSAPAKVTIRLKDGTIYTETVDYAKGTIRNPMTKKELQDKFRGLASIVLSDVQIEKIIKTIEDLEKLDNVSKLGLLLVAGGSR